MSASQPDILVVEDDVAIRKVLRMALEIEGFSVRLAGDGSEALEILKTQPAPDLILLDLLMPGMNGYEFLEHVGKDAAAPVARIPILVLSAVAKSAEDKIAGVQGVFQKPLDFDVLVRAIRDALRG